MVTLTPAGEREAARRAQAVAEGRCPKSPRYCQCPEHYTTWYEFMLELDADDN